MGDEGPGALWDVNFQCLSRVPVPSDMSLRDVKGEHNLSKDGGGDESWGGGHLDVPACFPIFCPCGLLLGFWGILLKYDLCCVLAN